MVLVDDTDPEIARAAEQTLEAIPRDSLAAFLARSDAPTEMRNFFFARGIEAADIPAPDGDMPFVDTAPEEPPAEEVGDEEQRKDSALKKISAMNVAQRITLAMKGSREERAILIRDSNKIVGAAVLSSPKLTEQEVESIAKMPTISDELLRVIANTRVGEELRDCACLDEESENAACDLDEFPGAARRAGRAAHLAGPERARHAAGHRAQESGD